MKTKHSPTLGTPFDGHIVMTPTSDWEKLKNYLLLVHKEYTERNGMPYCKNCGVDHEELVKDIEKLLTHARTEEREKAADLLLHCDWCKKCKPKAHDIADYHLKRGRFVSLKEDI